MSWCTLVKMHCTGSITAGSYKVPVLVAINNVKLKHCVYSGILLYILHRLVCLSSASGR
ncbi:hypothetical protein BABINDRAFT_90598 [Babjeviella inositovora NRRL Y-12698]|uniref:Uncharacterized protein n=1 Tax=Babjeviella inositovora NRRL Y-12698 TaxID=984486 RepID=A0A1E3QJU2_9ASCO|nr:uncharacterized protein BABINDRAFT_90598 [Babjeviella inositovora NRRL Y-12698]ODQ77956.1 hypothetical protein BABINDRAFT_90598 [Babjeviella inositovora NRRL Y-12698]